MQCRVFGTECVIFTAGHAALVNTQYSSVYSKFLT